MLTERWSLLLLTSIAYKCVADPFEAINPPIGTVALPPLNNSRAYNATPVMTSFGPLTAPTVLPYRFHVPNTQTYLRLGFGFRRHRLNPFALRELIGYIQHCINESIEVDGEHAYPPIDLAQSQQLYLWTLGAGIYIVIENVKGSGRYFTWGQLKNVVEGLRLFLIEGQRYYKTAFTFWDGRWQPLLGEGRFILEPDRDDEVDYQKV